MNKIEAKQRIEKLKKEIDIHRYNYAVLDKETLAPVILDDLKAELFRLENEYPDLITSDSPTQRVAGEVSSKFQKTNHSLPMISLFDAFSEADMLSWQDRNENYLKKKIKADYYCELKLDGLALNLKYEKSLFSLAATRGDGKVGENVTANARAIDSVPLRLRKPKVEELKLIGLKQNEIEKFFDILENGQIEIRGEVIMTKEVFATLNKKYQKLGKPLLANTRNAVAGSIRQLDPRISAERKLDFHPYDLILSDSQGVLSRGDIIKTRLQADKLSSLLGFKIIKQNCLASDLENVFLVFKEIEKKRDHLAFDIDGVVVKFNDLKLWENLGVVGKAPRYMMAYKFSAEQATTKVKDIIWQIGRTGILTPTAVLEPVKVGGAVISRSTLHNFDEINRLDLMLEDTVIIERSGDVIPKVISVLTSLRSGREKKIKVPETCPICEGRVEKVDKEVAYRCLNKNCYAVNLRKISHFVSKAAVNMDGLGPKVIEQFLITGLIKDAADLYTIYKEDLMSLERFGEKKADNVIATISKKKEIDLASFIYALGIRHVGEETADLLAKEIVKQKSGDLKINDLLDFFQHKDEEYFLSLEDVGPIVALSISDFWQDKHNLQLLQKFSAVGITLNTSKISSQINTSNRNNSLAAKTFVLTGSLSSLTRQEAKDKIKKVGAKISSDISSKTDYLLLGENPGSKLEKAKKLGIKIINENDFLALIK